MKTHGEKHVKPLPVLYVSYCSLMRISFIYSIPTNALVRLYICIRTIMAIILLQVHLLVLHTRMKTLTYLSMAQSPIRITETLVTAHVTVVF
jgi:hypothetical protein